MLKPELAGKAQQRQRTSNSEACCSVTPPPPPHVLMDIKVVQMVKARESPWHHGQCKGLDRFTLIQKYIIQLCRQHKSVFPHDISFHTPDLWCGGGGDLGNDWEGKLLLGILFPHMFMCVPWVGADLKQFTAPIPPSGHPSLGHYSWLIRHTYIIYI